MSGKSVETNTPNSSEMAKLEKVCREGGVYYNPSALNALKRGLRRNELKIEPELTGDRESAPLVTATA